MHNTFTMMAIAGVAGFLSAAPASAEGFVPNTTCGAASFSTCASARIRLAGPDLDVRVGHPRGAWGGTEGSSTIVLEGSQAVDWAVQDRRRRWDGGREFNGGECWSEERTGYRERVECASLVTPEPISMTLMATGLAGMSGMGWMRRRGQSQQ